MARLLITIGLSSKKADAHLTTVYLGRSGSDQLAAERASPLPHFLRLNHAIGVPKNNAFAAANAAALSPVEAEDEDSFIEVSHADMHSFQEEMKRLQQVAADRSVEIEQLKAQLASVPPVPPVGAVSESLPGDPAIVVNVDADAQAAPPTTTTDSAAAPKRTGRR